MTKHFSLLLACLMMPCLAQATLPERGDFMVRARSITVVPDEDADVDTIGGDVSIDTATVPEVDFSYFFADNWAVELIAAVTPHDVVSRDSALGPRVDLGSVTLLPPTLTVQYHYPVTEAFKPYVGAGINYTHFFNIDESSAINDISYDDSFGPALQIGADYFLTDSFFLNVDVKKVWISPDVTINNAINADVDINPWIVGVGVGYKF